MRESRKKRKIILAPLLALLLIAGSCLFPLCANAEVPEDDDYPEELKAAGKDCLVDPWNFYNRECVSFVAWRLNDRNGVDFDNHYGGVLWGNAENWNDAARSLGLTVDDEPAVGAVAYWESGWGHVAWVAAVEDGQVIVEEYNWCSSGAYRLRSVEDAPPDGYIHIRDLVPEEESGDVLPDLALVPESLLPHAVMVQ